MEALQGRLGASRDQPYKLLYKLMSSALFRKIWCICLHPVRSYWIFFISHNLKIQNGGSRHLVSTCEEIEGSEGGVFGWCFQEFWCRLPAYRRCPGYIATEALLLFSIVRTAESVFDLPREDEGLTSVLLENDPLTGGRQLYSGGRRWSSTGNIPYVYTCFLSNKMRQKLSAALKSG